MAAVTQEEIDTIESAYRRGVLSVGHGDKRVVYRSRREMRATIEEMKRELAGTSRPKNYGFVSTKRGIS